MTSHLAMELRSVNPDAREIVGVCIPYDEVSYLTPNPNGERVVRGAFRQSARQRGDKVLLFREHDHAHPIGRSISFVDGDEGLVGTFAIRTSVLGDQALSDIAEGYLSSMSAGFRPLQLRRGADRATEIVEGALVEVSLVALPAYEGARLLAVRGAAPSDWAIPATLDVDLSPVLPFWVG
jgi:HK97 family phage prohead protease